MSSIGASARTIPIQSHQAAAGCGACLHGDDGAPVCRSLPGDACAAPELSGPADELQRLMTALAPLLGRGEGAALPMDSRLVRALHVQPGEVALQLAVGRDCGAALADSAFQTLRGLLPDTDIYVTLVG